MSSVKEVFNQLNIKEDFEKFENATFSVIMTKISNLNFTSSSIDLDQIQRIKFILKSYANKIFKRKA